MTTSSCRKESTPAWDNSNTQSPAGIETSLPEKKQSATQIQVPTFTLIAYNLKNWLTIQTASNQGETQIKTKPEKEKQSIVELLASHQPDVLGVCEIGNEHDLRDLQWRLSEANLHLPFVHLVGGEDPERKLAILSRYPINPNPKPKEIFYTIQGKQYSIQRGILDVNIDINQKSVRFIGCHLKSKRENEENTQEAMRFAEASLLKKYIHSIMDDGIDIPFVLYGDFNDTPQSPSLQQILNKTQHKLYAIPLKDAHGLTWTHFWNTHDIYSRIDYVIIPNEMKSHLQADQSTIIHEPFPLKGSDHRALKVVFK